MDDFEKRLKEAFDEIHAEDELKASARKFLKAEREKRETWGGFHWLRRVSVAVCMLFLFFVGYTARLYWKPVSVISVDVNPSIELEVNVWDKVVAVEAYNPDGEMLMQDLKLRFLDSEDAVEKILESDTIQILLSQGEELILTVVGEDGEEAASLCTRLEAYVSDVENTYCLSTSEQAVSQAHHCGMSYGKYLAYLEAVSADETLTTQEAREMTMKEIRTIAGHTCGMHHGEEAVVSPTEETMSSEEMDYCKGKKKHHSGHH